MKKAILKTLICISFLPTAFAQATVLCQEALVPVSEVSAVADYAKSFVVANRIDSAVAPARRFDPQILSMSVPIHLKDGSVLYKVFLMDGLAGTTRFPEYIVKSSSGGALTIFPSVSMSLNFSDAENYQAVDQLVQIYNEFMRLQPGGGKSVSLQDRGLVDKIILPDGNTIFVVNVFVGRSFVRLTGTTDANGLIEDSTGLDRRPYQTTSAEALEIAHALLSLPKASKLSLEEDISRRFSGGQSWLLTVTDSGSGVRKHYTLFRSDAGFFDLRHRSWN